MPLLWCGRTCMPSAMLHDRYSQLQCFAWLLLLAMSALLCSCWQRAAIKYRQLNELALSVVRRGGLLMTCSCSGAMTQSGELPDVVQQAAVRAGRQVRSGHAASAVQGRLVHSEEVS
jgi:hypothetical protein